PCSVPTRRAPYLDERSHGPRSVAPLRSDGLPVRLVGRRSRLSFRGRPTLHTCGGPSACKPTHGGAQPNQPEPRIRNFCAARELNGRNVLYVCGGSNQNGGLRELPPPTLNPDRDDATCPRACFLYEAISESAVPVVVEFAPLRNRFLRLNTTAGNARNPEV